MRHYWEDLRGSLVEVPGVTEAAAVSIAVAVSNGRHIELCGPAGSQHVSIARHIALWKGGPMRAPHYTVSAEGMRGSIKRDTLTPGEIGRACGGVLYLDQAPEFSMRVLAEVAAAAENGATVHYWGEAKRSLRVRLPGNGFQLVMGSLTCPCGYHGHPRRACDCSETSVERFRGRLRKSLPGVEWTRVRIEPPPPKDPYDHDHADDIATDLRATAANERNER